MELWGLKTVAWFDVWSFEHILAGISFGAMVHLFHSGRISQKDHHYICIIFVLCIAFAWETIEHYLESGATGIAAVTYWFQGVEFWGNRIITDPLMVLLGHFIAVRWEKTVWVARVLSVIWLFFHVFIFPHSMYLHYFI